jgi:AraC-like DNA-binding protein
VTALLARRVPARVASGRPATEAAQRRLLARAREILLAEPRTALVDLGSQVGCSPHHLSRVFSRFTGSGVSRYRNRIRVGLALERLAGGETDIAAVAHDLGFADHAHLTRTIRAMTGYTPTVCRALLTVRGPTAGTR